jgi:hypothetical protein
LAVAVGRADAEGLGATVGVDGTLGVGIGPDAPPQDAAAIIARTRTAPNRR